MNALKVENLTYAKGKDNVILDNINFSIMQYDRLAVLGSNGSGKTSLIEGILGIIKPTNGCISFNGKNIEKIEKDYGVVWDQVDFFPWLKVKEVLGFFAAVRGVNLADCPIGKLLGIDNLMNKMMRVLSMGEKKKVAIIVALMHNPSFLFLDELSSDIDEQTLSALWQSYLKYEKTVLFTTHRWKEAETYATKFMFIQKGRLLLPPLTKDSIKKKFPFKYKIIIGNPLGGSAFKDYTKYIVKDQTTILLQEFDDVLLKKISNMTPNYSILDFELIDLYNYLTYREV